MPAYCMYYYIIVCYKFLVPLKYWSCLLIWSPINWKRCYPAIACLYTLRWTWSLNLADHHLLLNMVGSVLLALFITLPSSAQHILISCNHFLCSDSTQIIEKFHLFKNNTTLCDETRWRIYCMKYDLQPIYLTNTSPLFSRSTIVFFCH